MKKAIPIALAILVAVFFVLRADRTPDPNGPWQDVADPGGRFALDLPPDLSVEWTPSKSGVTQVLSAQNAAGLMVDVYVSRVPPLNPAKLYSHGISLASRNAEKVKHGVKGWAGPIAEAMILSVGGGRTQSRRWMYGWGTLLQIRVSMPEAQWSTGRAIADRIAAGARLKKVEAP